MGRPKPLLPLRAGTYLGTIIDTLARSSVETTLVVLGSHADEIIAAIDWGSAVRILNRKWRRGMLGSLQAAVRALQRPEPGEVRFDALLLTLVDVPRFSTATVDALVSAYRTTATPIVAPEYAGRSGHPVLLCRSLWPELLDAPEEEGAIAVIRRYRDAILRVVVDDPWVLRDADTPEEHAALFAEP